MLMLPTVVLVALDNVNDTVEFVAVTDPSVRLPVAPLAVRMFVEPLLPASWIPDAIVVKSIGPLLAVTSTFDPKDSGPATLVNAILVAAVTSPFRTKFPICENWIAPVVVVSVEPIVTPSLTVVEPEIVAVPAANAPVDTKVEPTLLLSESTLAIKTPPVRLIAETAILASEFSVKLRATAVLVVASPNVIFPVP